MKFDFIPETEEEKALLEHMYMAQENAVEMGVEERLSFLERNMGSVLLSTAMNSRQMGDIAETVFSEDDDSEEVQKVIDEIKAIRKEMEVFRQTILELEETKVRLRNTEYDLRQALSKISNLESKVGSLEFEFRNHREVHSKLINKHADQLDRLNKEVFDEEPEDIEP